MSNQLKEELSKRCSGCKTVKELREFKRNKSNLSGLSCFCKACHRQRMKIYYQSRKGLFAKIYSDQRRSSKARKHSMPDYSLDELRKFAFIQDNFEELYSQWVESGYNKMLVPSFDRLDDYKPYTLDNIQLTTWTKNKKRGHEDMKKGINNKNSKAVKQLTLEGELVAQYHSSKHASRSTGVSSEGISLAANGRLKTSGGFKWKFA